jgi:hypothetical protein
MTGGYHGRGAGMIGRAQPDEPELMEFDPGQVQIDER